VRCQTCVVFFASFFLPAVGLAGDEDLHIGMAKSFFAGRPKVFVDIVGDSFANSMKKLTGLDGHLNTACDAYELAEKLKERKLDFAIFHGHEFAAARKRFPGLQPLLIAANKHGDRAYLIVHRNSNARSAADLKTKKISLAVDARGHCRAFLEKLDNEIDQDKVDFSIQSSVSQIEALNELAQEKVDAVIVDSIGLAFFKELRGQVFAKNLKILLESEDFPAPVIACQKDALDGKIVARFREGLRQAQTSEAGQRLMRDWNIDSFDPVPKGYEQTLNDTFKLYPLAAR